MGIGDWSGELRDWGSEKPEKPSNRQAGNRQAVNIQEVIMQEVN